MGTKRGLNLTPTCEVFHISMEGKWFENRTRILSEVTSTISMLTLLRDSGAITPLSMVYTPYSQSVCSTLVKSSWCRVYVVQFRRGSSQARNLSSFSPQKGNHFPFFLQFPFGTNSHEFNCFLNEQPRDHFI
jgi:hypothetical protein